MKAIRLTTTLLLLIVAANALAAGYLFIVDPSGAKLHMSVSILSHSPFKNFLIPGIILFTMNGMLNLVAAVATILSLKIYPTLVVWQGIILIGWVVLQIILLQSFNFLHLTMIIIGLALFAFGNRLNV